MTVSGAHAGLTGVRERGGSVTHSSAKRNDHRALCASVQLGGGKAFRVQGQSIEDALAPKLMPFKTIDVEMPIQYT